ncbi:MAG: DUF4271 domain-containing protein [Tannerella sp.]|jgi:hypothetical protein|nr:DUF4271 domain-containing protein [Tannerella sp.]
MNTGSFEGFSGISLSEGQLIHDILLFAFIILLVIFALTFHNCQPQFNKMLRGLVSIKERQNLFDTPTQESVFFKVFMGFQALFLCAVIFFFFFCHLADIQEQTVQQALILLSVLFVLLALFYLLKRCLYFIYGCVFTEKTKFRLWNTTYHALLYSWGVLLYCPALWLLLDREHDSAALILFLFIFFIFRISAIYVKIRIFYSKNNGFLYLFLYLCAQEIIPLLFLYKSMTYLRDVIVTSILWQ